MRVDSHRKIGEKRVSGREVQLPSIFSDLGILEGQREDRSMLIDRT